MTGLRSELAGCLLGGALGDAVGGPYEGRARVDVVEFEAGAAAISDDTVLTIATCEGVLTAGGKVIPAHIADAYAAAWRRGEVTGVGSSTLGALRALADGTHWALAGASGEFSAGAGAAMRVAPLAFFLDATSENGRQLVRDVVRITHKNDEALAGALAVVLAVHFSRTLPAALVLEKVVENLPDSSTRDALLQRAASLESFASAVGTSGYAAHAVPVALFGACMERPPFEVIERLVRCGGDTDTIASIAGQIIGTRVRLEGLPEVAFQLSCAERLRDLAERLARPSPGKQAGATGLIGRLAKMLF